MNRYSHLILTAWDQTFLSNPAFVTWFEDQLKQVPLRSGELLENYVRGRIAVQAIVRTSLSSSSSSTSSSPSNLQQLQQQQQQQQFNSQASTSNYIQSVPSQPQQPQQQQQQQQRTQSTTDISEIFDMNSYSNETTPSTTFDNSFTIPTSTNNNNNNNNTYTNPTTDYSTYNFPTQNANTSGSNYYPPTSSSSSSSTIDPSALQPQLQPPTYPPPANYIPPPTSSIRPIKPFSPSPSPAPSLPPVPSTSTSTSASSSSNSGGAGMTGLQAQAELLHNERNAKLAKARLATGGVIEEAVIVVPVKSNSGVKKASSPSGGKGKVVSTVASSSKSTSTSSTKSTTTTARRDSIPSTKSEKPTEIELTQLWNMVASTAKELLTPSRLSKAPKASSEKLFEIISTFSLTSSSSSSSFSSSSSKEKEKEEISIFGDSSTIPPESRNELINLLNQNSKEGSEFYKILVKDEKLMLGIKNWFNGSILYFNKISKGLEVVNNQKNLKRLEGMLVGILLLFDKLPFTVDLLKKYNIGRAIAKLSTHPDTQVKNISARLVSKWSAFLAPKEVEASNDKSKRKSTDDRADPKKKPKSSEPTTSTSKPTTSTIVAKPAPISFAKPALPSFKKVPPPPPVILSPFEIAKAKMDASKAAASKPFASTSSSSSKPDVTTGGAIQNRRVSNGGIASSLSRRNKNGGQKVVKAVRFKEGDELFTIRIIPNMKGKKLDQFGQVIGGDSNDMEAKDDEMDLSADGEDVEPQSWAEKYEAISAQEGATHFQHFDTDMDEEIDWYEPIEVIVPATDEFSSFNTPAVSAEVEIQALRESTAIVPDYAFDLDSPSEPPSEPESTSPTLMIVLSSDLTNDTEVMRAIANVQLSQSHAGERRGSGNLANTVEIMSILNDLVPNNHQTSSSSSSSNSNNYDLPPHLRNQNNNNNNNNEELDSNKLAALKNFDPAIVANLVQITPGLQFLAGKLSPYGMGGQQQQQQQQQGPVTNKYGYASSYERPIPPPPSQSQQSSSSSSNSWEPNSNSSSQYSYGSTYAPTTEIITPKRGARGRVSKGRRSRKRGAASGGGNESDQVCKFWNTPKGCDWDDKCFNLHE